MKKKRIIIAIITFMLCLCSCKNVVAANYTDINISNNTFKSYMSYKALSKSNSAQNKLQSKCVTDEDGFRRCVDRYVIAVGSGVGGQVGDCVDLLLANDQIICCVIGDYKNDKHTDSANLVSINGCCAEFIVDTDVLRKDIKTRGDVSYGYPGWDSPVINIRRYVFNCLGGN